MSRYEDVELLVDSGALFTSIPRSILEKLGLKPIARYRLRTFSGEVVERDVGGAIIEYESRRAVVPVVFGESGDAQVLGVTTLETLWLPARPCNKEVETCRILNDLATESS
jgi:predicted aspartyl protease